MARLGKTDNPVDGNAFNLPSGYTVDEDNGDLAIRDTNGTVVMKWDDTNTQWDFSSNDVTNLASVETDKIQTGRTWQTVTGSRSTGTTYSNDTGSEIIIFAQIQVDSSASGVEYDLRILVNGEEIESVKSTRDSNEKDSVVGTIPVGADYEVFAGGDSANFALNQWREFRP